MAPSATTKTDSAATAGAKLLGESAKLDTVYADVYLRRARELLAPVLSRAQYLALKGIQRDIDEAVKQSKTATMLNDWKRVESLAAEAEQLRRRALEGGPLRELGAEVYEAVGVGIDPFSPGLEFVRGTAQDPAQLRDQVVAKLARLARDDAPWSALYDARRKFFDRLALESKRADLDPAAKRSAAQVQQLAVQAAQRGDMAQLRSYAEEILELEKLEKKDGGTQTAQSTAPASPAAYRCPVDLAEPFPDVVVERARRLGFAAARTEPLPEAEPLFDYVAARIWQPEFDEGRSETEGTMRAEAVVDELGLPAELAQPIKVLVGQFLRNPFVNSGGARYLPRFSPETVLIEDFEEDREPPAENELLRALGLERRRGLARVQIDDALLESSASVLEQHLGLDPTEFRLVCIPQDLYSRFGRDRGWGQRQQWSHFDGYQVLRNGHLRALIGGDVRYGGLNDLLSIGIADQRESVIVRFAVIRRARQVARWL